ncbi:MAG: DNA polymerase III subunit [Clostridia bacterium]|nr:DNA polymerase III subunit [Clostridia bacterium]
MISWQEKSTVASNVKNFIASRRIPHAILIEGVNETAKRELAAYIATAAVCSGESAPCGNCLNCHQANAKSHPDISYIVPLEGKKNLSVDQIRELRTDAYVKPHSAEKRVFIIEYADRMNPQAQNALLKVLEEPPADVIFILLTPSKTVLLDTIISRCVLLSLIENAQETKYTEMANQFIDLLLSGSEYEMLKLLTPLEKSRVDAENFFGELALCVAERIKKGSVHARTLDRLFDDTKYYLDLLKTNINMPLLICLAVSRSKGLLNTKN